MVVVHRFIKLDIQVDQTGNEEGSGSADLVLQSEGARVRARKVQIDAEVAAEMRGCERQVGIL